MIRMCPHAFSTLATAHCERPSDDGPYRACYLLALCTCQFWIHRQGKLLRRCPLGLRAGTVLVPKIGVGFEFVNREWIMDTGLYTARCQLAADLIPLRRHHGIYMVDMSWYVP